MSTKPPVPTSGPISVASAPPAAPLTDEQRRQRLVELRSRMGRSMIETTPPAGKVGYWAHKTDTREMGRLEWVGWTIVHDDPKKPAWKANGAQADGTYVVGDTILMEMDSEIYDLLQQEYRDLNEKQRVNAAAAFIDSAAKDGVPAFEVGERKG